VGPTDREQCGEALVEAATGTVEDLAPVASEGADTELADREAEHVFQGDVAGRQVCVRDVAAANLSTSTQVQMRRDHRAAPAGCQW
jgi:hypothetical protein